jgi:predicted unusual protein kinase regulating ubiquinone biosynthesis (AarF/ABC1/UbiB family)
MRAVIRHPGRVWQILVVFLSLYVVPRLPWKRASAAPGQVRARLALERLGGAWVKLGQMLAMRFDVLPATYCAELFKLLDQVQPFAYADVREIIRQELGDVPEVLFASFESASFAAASIGQVHRATLHSGEAVAVKVQRPNIRRELQADIDLMFAFSWVIDRLGLFGVTRSRSVIEEFSRWTADELDYLVEARQAVLLYEHARGERFERIARVHRDLTTSRVLTSEFIDGVPLVDIVVAIRDGDAAYLERLKAQGHDLDRIVLHLDWNMLNQVFVFGAFHADLHPANLYVLEDDAIGYVDFGIVGQLPDRVRESLTRYTWLLFRGEIEGAVRELMRWLAPTSASDADAARWQLIALHQAFLYETAAAGASNAWEGRASASADNPYLKLAVQIMQTIRVHELTLAGSLVAYLRMLVTLGTLRHQLARNYDLPRHVRRFFQRLIRQQSAALLDPRLTLSRLYAGGVHLQRAMDFLEFLEDQQPVIAEAEATLFGVRARVRAVRQRLVSLGIATIIVAVVLYFVLADPTDTQKMVPAGTPYTLLHFGLVALLILLVASVVQHLRRSMGPD